MASRLKELEAQYTAQQKAQQPTSSFWDRLKDLGSRALGAIVTALDAPSNFFRAKAQEAANEAQKRYEQLRKENPNRLTIKSAQDVKNLLEMKSYGRQAVAAGFFAGVASVISPSAWLDTLRLAYGAGKGAVGAAASAVRDPAGTLQKVKEEALKAPQYAVDFGKGLIDRPFHAGATAAELMGSIITPVPFASKVPMTISRTFKADVTALKAYSSTGDYLPLARAEPNRLIQMDPLKGWSSSWGHWWLEEYGYFDQIMPIKPRLLDVTLKDPEGLNDVMRFQPHKLEVPGPRETVFLVEGKLEPKGLPRLSIGRPSGADLLIRSPTEFLYFHKEIEAGKLSIRAGHVDESLLRLQSLDFEAGLTGGRFKSVGYLGEHLEEKAISWKMAMEDKLGALHEIIEEAAKPKTIKEELLRTKLEHEKLLDRLVYETKLSQAFNDPAKGIRTAEDLLEKIEVKGDVILAGELREPNKVLHVSRQIEELANYRPKHEFKIEPSARPVVKEGDIWGVGARATSIHGKLKDTTELYVVAPLEEVEKYIPVEKFAPEVQDIKPVRPKIEPPEKRPPELELNKRAPEPEPKPLGEEARAQVIMKAEERAMKAADDVELPVAQLEFPVPRGRARAAEAPRAISAQLDDVRPWLPEKTIELPIKTAELPLLGLPRLTKLRKDNARTSSPIEKEEALPTTEVLPLTEPSKAASLLLPDRERLDRTRGEVGLIFEEQERLLPRMLGEATLLGEQDFLKSIRAVYEELAPTEMSRARGLLKEKTFEKEASTQVLAPEIATTKEDAKARLREGLRELLFEEEARSPRTRALGVVKEVVRTRLESKPLHELSLRLYDATSPAPRLAPELIQPEAAALLPSHDISMFPLPEKQTPIRGEKERKTRGAFVSREPFVPRLELGFRDFEFSLAENVLEEPEEERRRKGERKERGKGEKVKAREYMLPEFLAGLGRF